MHLEAGTGGKKGVSRMERGKLWREQGGEARVGATEQVH